MKPWHVSINSDALQRTCKLTARSLLSSPILRRCITITIIEPVHRWLMDLTARKKHCSRVSLKQNSRFRERKFVLPIATLQERFQPLSIHSIVILKVIVVGWSSKRYSQRVRSQSVIDVLSKSCAKVRNDLSNDLLYVDLVIGKIEDTNHYSKRHSSRCKKIMANNMNDMRRQCESELHFIG